MGYIKEPIDVDLVVAPIPLTSEDKAIISACIAAYKKKKRTPRKKNKQYFVGCIKQKNRRSEL